MLSARERTKRDTGDKALHESALLHVVAILLIPLISLLFACAKNTPPAAQPGQETMPPKEAAATPSGPMTEGKAPSRGYCPRGIHLQYTSALDLNLYENRAHTILMVIYQLSGMNGYNSFVKTTDGLKRLMQADRFDASVVGVDQFFVEPNEKKILSLDRAENAQYVAIVPATTIGSRARSTGSLKSPSSSKRRVSMGSGLRFRVSAYSIFLYSWDPIRFRR